MEPSEAPSSSTGDTSVRVPNSHGGPRYARNNHDRTPRKINDPSRTTADQQPPKRHHKPSRSLESTQPAAGSSILVSGASAAPLSGDSSTLPRKRNPRNRKQTRPPNTDDATKPPGLESSKNDGQANDKPPPRQQQHNRGAKFNAELTSKPSTPDNLKAGPKPSEKYRSKYKRPQDPEMFDDLTSRLTHALSSPPYPDCPICFSAIHPTQPTWSCSPSIPLIRADNADSDEQQYCWTIFHMKCIGSWATRSVKEIVDAWRARGEEGRRGEWRCPGCQAKREIVPSGYWCFCNSTPEPRPPRLATPHSCGNPCSRIRESGCGHPCPLQCHPGPCPPCKVTTHPECYCPKKKILSFRCGIEGRGPKGRSRDLSCGDVCGRMLSCQKHACEKVCHDGDCGDCPIREITKCWCGKEENEVGCGEGEAVVCSIENEGEWTGRFGCSNVCGRSFDCGSHKCERKCHPPSRQPAPCPRSPHNITTCPCGKCRIASSASDTDPTALPPRSHCTSPIPTCSSPCDKLYPDCGHPCVATCHTGPCPPCSVSNVRPCRCGATTKSVQCSELHLPKRDGGADSAEVEDILCNKPCTVFRACGKHQCQRLCCPLASLASAAGKKGKKRTNVAEVGVGEERGGLHECDLICGKMLSCSNHTCEERDHKGVCPPCLRSSFEEMVCYCGRTILEPPIPCGTQIRCTYQCPRPPPPCGHSRTPHSCHEEPSLCPPCPFLATKKCACGKKMVGNVKCSLETDKVLCGSVCGKLMTCGFHHCERTCHSDPCGRCIASCGKSRKLCLPAQHPCTQACHAPSVCPEDEPCRFLLTLTCSCGRIRQAVQCGRSSSNTDGIQRSSLKCNHECSIAQRNAKLADALGITPDSRGKVSAVSYHEELIAFAKANLKFLGIVEKALADFVNSTKKTQVLPPMPPERRKFVNDLAGAYRMDTEMVDQDPHRSVRLFRRIDTRIPSPLLSNSITSSAPAPSTLGKLLDMKGSASSSWRSSSTSTLPKLSAAVTSSPSHGWSSAVTQQTAVRAPMPAPATIPSSTRSPSAHVSRTSTPVPAPVSHNSTEVANIPDNWEDEV